VGSYSGRNLTAEIAENAEMAEKKELNGITESIGKKYDE